MVEFIYRNPVRLNPNHLNSNPDEDASTRRKLNLTQMLNQARGLGWEIPKGWSGWEYHNLPIPIQELSDDELDEILEIQAKLLNSVAPSTDCKDAFNWKNIIQTSMQLNLSKKGELYWAPPNHYYYKGKDKHFYVYDLQGKKKDVKWRREPKLGNKELPDCYPNYVTYRADILKKHFSYWPVAFLPSRWASELDKEPLLQLFENGVVTISEDIQSKKAKLPKSKDSDEVVTIDGEVIGKRKDLPPAQKHAAKSKVVEETDAWTQSLLSEESEITAASSLPGVYLLKSQKPVAMIVGTSEDRVKEEAARLQASLGADQTKFVTQLLTAWVPKEPHLSKALEQIKSNGLWVFSKASKSRRNKKAKKCRKY